MVRTFVESGKEEAVQKFLRLQFDEQALYSIIPKKKSQNEKPESNTRHSKDVSGICSV